MRKPILVLAILALAALAIGQSKSGDPKRFVRTFPPSDQEQTATGSGGPLPDEQLPSTLITGLLHAWPLSADGLDAHGSNDLTNNNGVTFVSKGGGAPANMPATVANFVAASSQTLDASSGVLGADADVTLAVWFYMNADVVASLFDCGDGGSGGGQLSALRHTANTQLYIRDFGQTVTVAVVPSGEWHLLFASHDSVANLAALSIDDAVPTTLATGGPNGALDELQFGGGIGNFLQGKLSSPLVWDRVLTSTERACLFASGAGAFYPFTGVCTP